MGIEYDTSYKVLCQNFETLVPYSNEKMEN